MLRLERLLGRITTRRAFPFHLKSNLAPCSHVPLLLFHLFLERTGCLFFPNTYRNILFLFFAIFLKYREKSLEEELRFIKTRILDSIVSRIFFPVSSRYAILIGHPICISFPSERFFECWKKISFGVEILLKEKYFTCWRHNA